MDLRFSRWCLRRLGIVVCSLLGRVDTLGLEVVAAGAGEVDLFALAALIRPDETREVAEAIRLIDEQWMCRRSFRQVALHCLKIVFGFAGGVLC